MSDIASLIEQHDRIRDTCYELGLAEDHGWLATAYRNSGSTDIIGLTVTDGGIKVEIKVWTSQTGGSYEYIEFEIPADRFWASYNVLVS